MITVSGYTDWDASLQEIKQEVAPLGIQLNIQDVASATYSSRLDNGDYDLAYGAETGGPAPYYELRQMLYSANSAPLGKAATSNWERFSDPAVDKLIESYASSTDAEQHTIINQLQKVMLEQVPVLPTTENVDWFQYNTKNFTGWPTAQDQYALPSPYSLPDQEQVLLHLSPK